MNLTLERSNLLTALTRVSGIAGKNHSILVCRHVMIEAVTGQLTFRATNLDMEITVTTPAEVTKPGVCLVLADTLLNIAKNASAGADITFELGERLAVRSGRSKFNLATLPIAEFPTFASLDKPVSFPMPAHELAALISRPAFSAGHDASRFFLTGVYLFSKGGQLGSVATDGKRLTLYEFEHKLKDFGVIVPPAMVTEMTKLLDGDDEAIMAVSNAKIAVSYGTTLIVSKVIDGEYPNFRAVIPTDWPSVLTVDREILAATIRRASIASEDTAFSVRVVIANGLMSITGRGQDADAADECECDYGGEELSLGLNSLHTLDALSACGGEQVEISFARGAGNHLMMRAVGDEMFRAVMLPLKA